MTVSSTRNIVFENDANVDTISMCDDPDSSVNDIKPNEEKKESPFELS